MKTKTLLAAVGFLLSSQIAMPLAAKEKGMEHTVVEHRDGTSKKGTTDIRSDKDGSVIKGYAGNESTRETHREAVDRIVSDAKNRGEKTVVKKK